MFSENKRKQYARLLDLDEDELKEFIKRYVYYLRSKKEISPNSVLNGFFILADLRYKKDQTKALRAKYKTKNKYIIRYRDEIIELYQNGFGYVRISNQLYVEHRVKVSKSSIARFLKTNRITRNG